MAMGFHLFDRIGVDTGGTFTDVVLLDAQGVVVATHKLPSTPDDPGRAVLDGIDAVLVKAGRAVRDESLPQVVHGSTVATNALLEGDTAGAALITTEGFEDVLRIARQDRPDLYALVPRRPDPPISADRCYGLRGRMDHHGQAVTPLDSQSLGHTLDALDDAGVRAVAVCLLHSYANPAHERAVADALRERFGEALHLTVSSELLPEYREYERAATCVINAAVAPKMAQYLGRLSDTVGADRLTIMGSHGGTLPAEDAIAQPVRTVLSGPAGGVLGAAALAQAPDIITFDMGGTSTDVALCRQASPHAGGRPRPGMTTEGRAAGLPVRLPMVDIHTVGAGGGSIAWVDAGGALRVGPRSAGAVPGPACYGNQAGRADDDLLATVTDAHVVVEHLAHDTKLAGDLPLDVEAAHRAVAAVARRAGLEPWAAAWGILEIAETTMARAIHRVSLERGYDPARAALLTFGGAGGLHACRLAARLGMRQVIVPMHAGLLSAVGMLGAPVRHTFSHHLGAVLDRATPPAEHPAVAAAIAELMTNADAALPAHGSDTARSIDVEIAVPLAALPPLDRKMKVPASARFGYAATHPASAFEAEHERLYGYRETERAVESTCIRLTLSTYRPGVTLPRIPKRPDGPRTFGDGQAVDRDALHDDDRLLGPVTVREYSATTIVPEGWSGLVYRSGRIVLTRQPEADDA